MWAGHTVTAQPWTTKAIRSTPSRGSVDGGARCARRRSARLRRNCSPTASWLGPSDTRYTAAGHTARRNTGRGLARLPGRVEGSSARAQGTVADGVSRQRPGHQALLGLNGGHSLGTPCRRHQRVRHQDRVHGRPGRGSAVRPVDDVPVPGVRFSSGSDGWNLCAHLEDGERVESAHWYLLPSAGVVRARVESVAA